MEMHGRWLTGRLNEASVSLEGEWLT
jgi:hypothetical protein